MALICKTNLGRRKKLPVLNELKKDVLNNTKSKTIYEENHQIYQLCQKLRQIRKEKNLTQKDVAAHLNVPHSAISDIENGKRDITVSELKVFSNLYGRSVEEIMSGKKYDYYNIANIARLLTELPDDDLKEIMFIIEYKRKRNEERHLK